MATGWQSLVACYRVADSTLLSFVVNFDAHSAQQVTNIHAIQPQLFTMSALIQHCDTLANGPRRKECRAHKVRVYK